MSHSLYKYKHIGNLLFLKYLVSIKSKSPKTPKSLKSSKSLNCRVLENKKLILSYFKKKELAYSHNMNKSRPNSVNHSVFNVWDPQMILWAPEKNFDDHP